MVAHRLLLKPKVCTFTLTYIDVNNFYQFKPLHLTPVNLLCFIVFMRAKDSKQGNTIRGKILEWENGKL